MSSQDSPKASVHFHSLGCPKNLLDTEVMLGALATHGYALAERLEDADVAVVNTCSFIESAREESIQAILDVADLRESGTLRALVVTGCLPQRYGAELAKELPEVDAFVGTGAFPAIAEVLDDALAGRSRGVYVDGSTHLYDDASPRVLTGPGHSAYVKIAEGCDRICAFCAIPGIRGRFQSRTLASLVTEAAPAGRRRRARAQPGGPGLHLLGQGSAAGAGPGPPAPAATCCGPWTRWRASTGSGCSTSTRRPSPTICSRPWPRASACCPTWTCRSSTASDAMLTAMKRGTTAARQQALVQRIREAIPGVTLRTTMIVGFPGETEADFEELLRLRAPEPLRPPGRVPLLGRGGHGRLRPRAQGAARGGPRSLPPPHHAPARDHGARPWRPASAAGPRC